MSLWSSQTQPPPRRADQSQHSDMLADQAWEAGGRGLHSSAFQLSVGTFCVLHAPTVRLDVSTLRGLFWELFRQKRLRLS